MSLKNSGGFVTRVYFTYLDDDGNKVMTTKNNGDLLLGQTQTIDPATLGVPDGSMVYLYAFVVWGTDNEAKRAFIYEKGNANIANWVITGTTLNNDLGLTNISS